MLLRFGASNFRSLKTYQELSLLASGMKETMKDGLIPAGALGNVLPAIIVYGANASGKSNVLLALHYFHDIILFSQTKGAAGGGLPRDCFALDDQMSEAASRFDCDIWLDDVRYHYGFVIDDVRVREEWLYAYPRGKRQVWFHRNADDVDPFYFGKSFGGQNKVIKDLTRENSLFLSTAAQNNHRQVLPIYNFFYDDLIFLISDNGFDEDDMDIYDYLEDDPIRRRVLTFLKSADVGIVDAIIEEVPIPGKFASRYVITKDHYLVPLLDADGRQEKVQAYEKRLRFGHRASGDRQIFLSHRSQSRGTRQILKLLGPILDALDHGRVIVIDELDASMHPLLSRKILDLFNMPELNPRGAQLICSTHDTNLLSRECLRRDQIWFTEKDREGATHLFPLTDIRTGPADDIEKGYLQGRFGAIPFLGDLRDLLDLKE